MKDMAIFVNELTTERNLLTNKTNIYGKKY